MQIRETQHRCACGNLLERQGVKAAQDYGAEMLNTDTDNTMVLGQLDRSLQPIKKEDQKWLQWLLVGSPQTVGILSG